jgi:hypothetical protein
MTAEESSGGYRQGFAQTNPTPESSIDPVKDAVREEYKWEQQVKRSPSVEPSSPTPERQKSASRRSLSLNLHIFVLEYLPIRLNFHFLPVNGWQNPHFAV